jgi:hypothetical protein
MTRINVVEPTELTNKHLMGEIHEITRVYGLVRKAQQRKINKYNFHAKIKQPAQYTLGKGHVYFFYDKLGYITERYYALNAEAKSRGYKVNPIAREDLEQGIDKWWMGDYTPTPQAIEINRQRINERLEGV